MPALNNVFGVYIIRDQETAVIEPGPARTIPIVRDALRELGISDVRWIIPTHLHVDHAGGMGALALLYPQSRVLLHPRGIRHAIDPTRLIEGSRMVWGVDFEENFGRVMAVPEQQAAVAGDGDTILAGARELQIVHAPGHAPHQIVVFDRQARGIFCGDSAGMMAANAKEFPLPNTAPPGFDLQVYLETLERLRNMGADVLFYSHGGVVYEPESVIVKACEITRAFGDLVLQGLKDGGMVENVTASIREYARRQFGVELDDQELAMTVSGYIYYYRDRGMA